MNSQIKAAFPKCTSNSCIEISKEELIEVYDCPEKKRCFLNKDSVGSKPYPFFTIKNPKKKDVNFLAIDNCILFDCDGEKCDFATFTDKDFYFVELKKASNETYRSEKKEKALSQLKTTISLFSGMLNFNKINLKACACVGYFTASPAAPASDLNDIIEFINYYHTELVDGNIIEFN